MSMVAVLDPELELLLPEPEPEPEHAARPAPRMRTAVTAAALYPPLSLVVSIGVSLERPSRSRSVGCRWRCASPAAGYHIRCHGGRRSAAPRGRLPAHPAATGSQPQLSNRFLDSRYRGIGCQPRQADHRDWLCAGRLRPLPPFPAVPASRGRRYAALVTLHLPALACGNASPDADARDLGRCARRTCKRLRDPLARGRERLDTRSRTPLPSRNRLL